MNRQTLTVSTSAAAAAAADTGIQRRNGRNLSTAQHALLLVWRTLARKEGHVLLLTQRQALAVGIAHARVERVALGADSLGALTGTVLALAGAVAVVLEAVDVARRRVAAAATRRHATRLATVVVSVAALGARSQATLGIAALVEALATSEAGVALLVGLDAIVAAVRGRLGLEATRRLALEHLADRVYCARREVVVVPLVALVGEREHDEVATICRARRTLGLHRIVLRAPIVAELYTLPTKM